MGMARLIDAKELENQVKAAFSESNPVLMGQMLRWIRKQKTIDAVSVVLCKDCKHYVVRACACRHENFNGIIHSDGFCSYGERETDEI